ncbi:MAG: L-serine ammonia-lyase, iron-sulfur-dependent, subunit alpha [Oscillospiraceae bacterium]
MLTLKTNDEYIKILKEELVPALGCTEPIALAYAAAKAQQVLGCEVSKVTALCSGNMIKNVRCVTIPNSKGMVGVAAAVCLGIFGGDADKEMEVLASVTEETRKQAQTFIENNGCSVEYLDTPVPLHFIIKVWGEGKTAAVHIKNEHTNITKIEKDGKIIFEGKSSTNFEPLADRSCLNIDDIKTFCDEVDIGEIEQVISKLVRYNMAIAEEGLTGKYGLDLGNVILNSYPDSVLTKMKSYAAAASEARMCGCDLPVIINSGSGNQGIASSVPVIVFAQHAGIRGDKLYRCLAFSALLTVYQKEFIGKLSAFCGAVSASCASAAAITYMESFDVEKIKYTIANTLANIPGIICDGAKDSCSAKIASSLDAAMMAHFLAMKGKVYDAFSGILKENAGETISCVGYIGKEGMRETDKEIIKIMLQ